MVSGQRNDKGADGESELSSIKHKLAWRIGLAGLMVVGLLGGLAFFDYLTAPSNEPQDTLPHFPEAVPVQKKVITQPVTPAVSASSGPAEIKMDSTPESTAAPADNSAHFATTPPPPEVPAQSSFSRSVKSPHPRPTAALDTTPVRHGEQGSAEGVVASRAEQSAPSVSSLSLQPRSQMPLPGPHSGYVLQAGVFIDPKRAEELHARLVQEGIPSTIEARVLVGPFKSRREADAARVKLRAMGVESMQLPKSGKK